MEDGLGEGKPLRLIRIGVLEVELGGRHGGHTPESYGGIVSSMIAMLVILVGWYIP